MNQGNSSKFVPGLPADDDINTPTNENAAANDDSIKVYDGVAECTANDSDTFKSVKLRAKDLAIEKVQKKIADYVYAFWKDRYLTLPDDEVLSIANEICTITDVKYNVLDSDDKILIRATVLAKVNDNDLMNYIIQFFKERTKLKSQNEALRKENEDLKRQIAELTKKVKSEDKNMLAIQKCDEAFELLHKGDVTGAIKLYDEAIQLNPSYGDAYYWRGIVYINHGKEELANRDFDKAKELGYKPW